MSAVAVLPEGEGRSSEMGEIPTLPLAAEESVEDANLDPECPEIHEGIMRVARKHS